MSKKQYNNILLISSDAKLNELVNRYAKKFKFNLTLTDSGSKGIQSARESTAYPIIIITQLLFDISGSKAISILKKQEINSTYILITPKINRAEHNTFLKDGADIIYSTPLNIGNLLLDIQHAIENYSEEDEDLINIAESPPISMQAAFQFTIRDISETGCLFRSTFPIEKGSVLILESKEVSDKLALAINTIYPVRVMNCEQVENNKGYDLGGVFVGLQRKITSRLKHACLSTKGFKFTTQS